MSAAAGGAGTNGQQDNKKSKIQLMVKSQSSIFAVELYCILFDGHKLRPEQTPDQLEMEDGDEIDAMQHRTGGWGARVIKFA